MAKKWSVLISCRIMSNFGARTIILGLTTHPPASEMPRKTNLQFWIISSLSQRTNLTKTLTIRMSCPITSNSNSHLLAKAIMTKHCIIYCCRLVMKMPRSHWLWIVSFTRRIRRLTLRVKARTKTNSTSCFIHRVIIKTSFSKRWSRIQSEMLKHQTPRLPQASWAASHFSKISWQMKCRLQVCVWPQRRNNTGEGTDLKTCERMSEWQQARRLSRSTLRKANLMISTSESKGIKSQPTNKKQSMLGRVRQSRRKSRYNRTYRVAIGTWRGRRTCDLACTMWSSTRKKRCPKGQIARR